MEKFEEYKEKANRCIYIADHMLYVTYPLVKDNKLLLAIMDNIFLSLTNSIAAVLYYDRLYKRIPPFQDTFESKFRMFRDRCIEKYKIDKSYILFIQDIKDIIVSHRKSPIEFARKDKFVICNDNYRMKTISIEEIKKYVAKAKVFIQEMNIIISKNEGLFG
jgi:hypothetical protein